MSINQFLPFISTAIMLVFVISVLRRYFATKQLHFLFWGMGLAMFGIGSFAEAYLALSWNKWMFVSWYYFGAVLNAAWIGHGTLYLMVKRKWRHGVTVLLISGSLFAGYLMLQAVPLFDSDIYITDKPVSEQYGTKPLDVGEEAPAGAQTTEVVNRDGVEVLAVRGVLPYGTPVRLTTPLMNIYGLLALVGGAIYSAYLFWRKRVMPNRVIGNIIIAFGALLIGGASVATRLGYGQFLYIGELLAAIIMFVGFRITSRPQVEQVPSEPAAAD